MPRQNFLIPSALFLASVVPALASQVALNLGTGTHAAQAGYDTIGVPLIAMADSPGTLSLGTFDGVAVSVAKLGTAGRLRNINRGDSYMSGEGILTELCDSWIGTEQAPDAMVIILSGVSPGVHQWNSYHIDEGTAAGQGNQNATMEVSLSTDGGATFVSLGNHMIKAETYDGPITNPNPFRFNFTPTGGMDVHVKFVTVANGTAGAGGDFTILNGFDIAPNADSDGDGLPDAYEQQIIDADPGDAINTVEDVLPGDDFDEDFSSNLDEFNKGTSPIDSDSDDDGLLDGHETGGGVWTSATDTGTNPLNPDTDGDGLLDGVENPDLPYDPGNPTTQPGTDPNKLDSDGDFVSDGQEVLVDGTDPTDLGDFAHAFPASVAKFDINLGAGPTQFDWTAAPDGNGSDGTISIATSVVGATAIASRDRGVASTDGPTGELLRNNLWRDFIFANPSTGATPGVGLHVDVTGLDPNTFYPITVFAYDPSSTVTRAADWSDGIGGPPARLVFAGGGGLDPNSLSDYSVTFKVFTSPSGETSFEGIVSVTSPNAASPNVFLNGIVIGPGVPDQDLDGLPDPWEQQIIDADPDDGINTINDVNPGDDFDGDDSTNANEFEVGTDPVDPDTDHDGALDGHETNTGFWTSATDRGTDPFVPDTDGDGLLDGVENPDLPYDPGNPTTQPGTDPHKIDTDGDFVSDAQEVNTDGTDPTDIGDFVPTFPAAIAKFDFNTADSTTQFDWTGAPLGAGSDGTVSINTTALGTATVDSRDRGAANTDGPGGDFLRNDLWKDFVFANGSTAADPTAGLQVDITGLAPFTAYGITVSGYDQSSGGAARRADWSQVGCSLFVTQTLEPGVTGDPASASSFAVTLDVLTDGSGAVSIQGIVASVSPSASHNVFVNYLVIGPPTALIGDRDCDGDGMVDLLDLAYGFDPFSFDAPGQMDVSGGVLNNHGLPITRVENVPNGVNHSLIYGRRDDLAALGLSLEVRFSHDMVTWFPGDPGAVVASDGGIEAVQVQYPFFLPNGRKARFWQVVVTVL